MVTDFQAYTGIICKLTNCPELSGVVQVENDAVVALTLKIPETGEWEDVNIEKPADHANLIESESS
jgi:hypothetical protein